MTSDQRERLRIIIESSILVRRGAVIDDAVAEERSRNMTTICELFFSDMKTETTQPGVGETAETMEERMAEMERDANELLRRSDR